MEEYQSHIHKVIQSSINLKKDLLKDKDLLKTLEAATSDIIAVYREERKVLFCGNGGSAADAQHLATELSGRFYFDRPPLFAEVLHVNTSFLTAVSNDYSFAEAYARLVKAKGRTHDILIALSTSGNSANVVNACKEAKKIGMKIVGFTGMKGGEMAPLCDHLLKIPSSDTPRIQECHMLLGHILCEWVERSLFTPPN
ncbi:UNVERIFIED_CONTAM: hypothetical protein GTU68_032923 [Idotea baltica]|nr:hypothetical protein [Idotea baltica]